MKGSLKRKRNSKGEWVWRFQWREDGHGRTKILGKCHEIGKAEARAMGNALVESGSAPKRSTRKRVTLTEYVREEYLLSRSAIWKRSTEYSTTDLIDRYILKPIGSGMLALITRSDLEALLMELASRGISASIVKRVRFQLAAIFRMAESDGLITSNPALSLKTPRNAKPRKPPVIGDEDLIRQAIMKLPTQDKLFLIFTAHLGMRPGEVAALKIGDIQAGILHVRRRIYRGVVDVPKSRKGERPIPVHSYEFLIAEHISHLLDQSPDGWLFPSENGRTPINYPNIYRKHLRPVLEAVGLRGFNFQAARATFARALKSENLDARLRADIMGHTVDVHEVVYQRTSDDDAKQAMERVFDRLTGRETSQ